MDPHTLISKTEHFVHFVVQCYNRQDVIHASLQIIVIPRNFLFLLYALLVFYEKENMEKACTGLHMHIFL
jgi:hypothetical protein